LGRPCNPTALKTKLIAFIPIDADLNRGFDKDCISCFANFPFLAKQLQFYDNYAIKTSKITISMTNIFKPNMLSINKIQYFLI